MILIKRYGMPLVAAVALYSVIYFVFGNGSGYIGMGLALSVLSAYLIRICDDIGDYERDKSKGRAPIGKKALTAMAILAVLANFSLALIAKAYLMLISPIVILLQFLINDKYREVIKPLFMPTIVITVVFSFFSPNLWLYVIVPILIISDIILIVYKYINDAGKAYDSGKQSNKCR